MGRLLWTRAGSNWIAKTDDGVYRIKKWIVRDHGSTMPQYAPSYGDEQGKVYPSLKEAKTWCENRAQLEECRARWKAGDYSLEMKVLGLKKGVTLCD